VHTHNLKVMDDHDGSPDAVLGASGALPRPAMFSDSQPSEEDSRTETEVFDELLCPLSATLMHDPVTLPCGHSFSRSALVM
jgi:hypothetical protein